MLHDRQIWLCVPLAIMAIAGHAPPAMAFTETAELGNTEVAFFAPDWIWQRREANILFTARNRGDAPTSVRVSIQLPGEDHFTFEGDRVHVLEIAPGASVRGAFKGILAKSGVPCQTYAFGLTVESDGQQAAPLPYALKTIRGAVTGSGPAAITLPVVISLAFTIVFAVALRALSQRGAWRTLGPRLKATDDRPEWIDEAPHE